MLSASELRHWVNHFQVPELQIRRDHLLSHALNALSAMNLDVVFFGGTALCRTHLLDWRLSEDIDLLTAEMQETAHLLETVLPRHLRSEYPGAEVSLRRDTAGRSGVLSAGDAAIRLQLVAADASYRRYPTCVTRVALRYEDLPAVVDLTTPTPVGAAAMKLSAWAERAAPRDLCDLYGLASRGLLGPEAVQLAAEVGIPPAPWMYADDRAPSTADWHAALRIRWPTCQPPEQRSASFEMPCSADVLRPLPSGCGRRDGPVGALSQPPGILVPAHDPEDPVIDDRHITAFGQHLVPEAFSRPHTADLVEQVEEVPHGADAFDRWRDRLVDACIADRYPAGHRPVRIVIVEGSDGVRWRWDGEPCCPAEWLVSRVRREASPIPDPWVFAIELPSPEVRFEVIDPVTKERVELREPVWLDTRWDATWYAEARGRGVARTCAGVVDLEYVPSTDNDVVHGRYPVPVDTGRPRGFHRILYGHPARRANPLRRA